MDVFPIILVIHLILAVSLVGVILLQRSEGGALGIGGGGGGGGLMSGRAAGNLLTKTTGILATGFFVTSLSLALLANARSTGASPFEKLNDVTTSPAAQAPAAPAEPTGPSAPMSR